MFRLIGLLAGFGLLLLLAKGVFFFLPLLAIVFFFRLVIGGFGPFGRGSHAYAFGQGRQGFGPRVGPRGYHWQADREQGCYSYRARGEYQTLSAQATPDAPHAATGPTVRL